MQRRLSEEPHEFEPGRGIPSWEELWQRAYRLLQSRFARGWQPADWEDMAQEAVFKVIVALAAETVDVSRFEAWFRTVVRNIAYDRYRTEHGREGDRSPVAWQDDDNSEDTRLAAAFTQTLANRDVQALLDVLPPHERLEVELAYLYELTSTEIAQVLGEGVSASTVRTHLRNALRKLRAYAREA